MPSFLSYLKNREKATVDAAKDVEWITVKGNHIPIKAGQNKGNAIKEFFESKNKESAATKKSEKKSEKQEKKTEGTSGLSAVPKKYRGKFSAILKKVNESANNSAITPEQVIKDAVASGRYSEKDILKRNTDFKNYMGVHIMEDKKGIRRPFDTVARYKKGGEWVGDDYEGGTWTAERKKVQNDIIRKDFKGWKQKLPKDGEKPKLVILGGRGGSGKSFFTDGSLGDEGYDPKNFLVVDPDAYKEQLPEYKDLVDSGNKNAGLNAWEVHEESSEMKKRALAKAKKLGINTVLDGTLAKSKSVLKTIKEFEEAGYDVEGAYMHLPREISAVRGLERGMRVSKTTGGRMGRWVPTEMLLAMKNNENVFKELLPYFKKWGMYDNNVPRGTKPKLIAKSEDEKKIYSLRSIDAICGYCQQVRGVFVFAGP